MKMYCVLYSSFVLYFRKRLNHQREDEQLKLLGLVGNFHVTISDVVYIGDQFYVLTDIMCLLSYIIIWMRFQAITK